MYTVNFEVGHESIIPLRNDADHHNERYAINVRSRGAVAEFSNRIGIESSVESNAKCILKSTFLLVFFPFYVYLHCDTKVAHDD